MISVFAAAWRMIMQRARAEWTILAAAGLIILLATTLLAAGPIYASAVAISGLHRQLRDAPVTEANVEITARARGSEFARLNAAVDTVVDDGFRQTGGPIVRAGRTDSFALPDQPSGEVRNLGVFGFREGIETRASLLTGNWPTSNGSVVQAAISESTATLLSLTVGSELRMPSRRDNAFVVTARIVGVYRLNDPNDPYWWDSPLLRDGVEEGQSFTTFGPFVVDPDTFFTTLTPVTSEVNWHIYPAFENLTVEEVAPQRGNVEALEERLNVTAGVRERFQAETELDDILRAAERSLLVTRTGVTILTAQLAILAGYALFLTAGLLIEQRRVETALLRSRGAGTGQVAAMALMEGLALAAPAAVLGPWLAAFSLRLLNVTGPLTTIDLDLDPVVNRSSWLLATGAATGCVVTLVAPAFLSARSFINERTSLGRQEPRGIAQRAGIDLALLVAAAIGYWQLRRYGAPITESVKGRLGLDPLLVAAPALGLLAGGVVALRFVPLLAHGIDRVAGVSRGLVISLGVWQLARRPARYARSGLLLMLALAIGLFAISYTRTWNDSQADQAAYQVGADIRVSPDRRTGTAIAPIALASAYQHIRGVRTSMPVSRDSLTISRTAGTGRALALDARDASAIVAFRADLAPDPLDQMMRRLDERRSSLPEIGLPGQPQRLAFTAQIALDSSGIDADGLAPSLSIVARDGRGLLHRLSAGTIAADGALVRLVVPVAERLESGAVATPIYPLSIISVETRTFVPEDVAVSGQIRIAAIETSETLDGDNWETVAFSEHPSQWEIAAASSGGVNDAPNADALSTGPDSGLSFHFSTGFKSNDNLVPVVYSLTPAGEDPTPPLAALASDLFLDQTEARVGETVQLDIGGARRPVEIVGSFAAFPTLDPRESGIVVVDLPSLAAHLFATSGRVDAPDEWWIAADEAFVPDIAASLAEAPYSSARTIDRLDRADTLRTDPVALGIIGALSLGFVAAALFAAIGFAVSAAVSARERLTEFALLRALGLSPGQLSGWLSIENGLLVALGLTGGTALGLSLAWLVLPFVTLTQDASSVVPGVILAIPWRDALLLEAVAVTTLGVVVSALAILLRRIGLSAALRLGEE